MREVSEVCGRKAGRREGRVELAPYSAVLQPKYHIGRRLGETRHESRCMRSFLDVLPREVAERLEGVLLEEMILYLLSEVDKAEGDGGDRDMGEKQNLVGEEIMGGSEGQGEQDEQN